MNLSINTVWTQAQPKTTALGYVTFDRSPVVSAVLLGLASVASSHAGNFDAAPSFENELSLAPYYSSLSHTAADSFSVKRWAQLQSSIPTDEEFANLATGLADRQRSAPIEIDEIIALHMAELYD